MVADAAPPEELRQAIKDKLSEMGHEPKTVQVCLQETGHGTRIGLQDAEGIFYDIAPEDPDGAPLMRKTALKSLGLGVPKTISGPYARPSKR